MHRGLLVCAFALTITHQLWIETTQAQAQHRSRQKPSQQFKGYGLPEPVKKLPQHLAEVPPVDASRKAACREAAHKIDDLVAANLAKLSLQPNPLANDHTFVRRVFLDTVGTIPTLIETNAYASSFELAKQEALIDTLLSSHGYPSHMLNYWSNILRIMDRPEENILAYGFRDWVREQMRINRPYDKWVYEMLTASGKVWDNPAVGYALRDNGMPMVHVDNTIRIFLGTQIGCAQCHDHPFDKWTQKEFYRLAAFTHGMQTKESGEAASGAVKRVKAELLRKDPDARLPGPAEQVLEANQFRVAFDPDRKLTLPHDYQYSDGKPSEPVEPTVLWGAVPELAAGGSSREQYAAWLTSPENERFAKTLANRLWKKIMGVGLIEPADDIRDDSPCENPELLQFLTEEIVRLKFNQKEFIRTLLYTQTYRHASSNFDPSAAEFYHFPGPRLRRMTAEQVWDSVLTIAIYNPYPYSLPDNAQLRAAVDLDLTTITARQAEEHGKVYDDLVGPAARFKSMTTAAYCGEILARASELPTPLPAEHFIRQFGQCDRETIEGDSSDPNVPQILAMFNGPFTHMMLEEGSVINDFLKRAKSPRDALDVMFLSILNRPPTSHDRDIALAELGRGDTAMGYGNVVWALINTREFLFVQ